MDEYNKYAALADTIQIEKITSDRRKQSILQRVKDNDERFDKLWICSYEQVVDELDYDFDSAEELAWLGYYLGHNTNVKELYISSDLNNSGKDVFRRGLGKNKSICHLHIEGFDLLNGQMFRMLDIFLNNNNNLSKIKVNDCRAGAEGVRQLSLAIGDCNRSLKHFTLVESNIGGGQLVDIITALSMHPQLTKLRLADIGTNMGRNECAALSTLLRCTTTQLQKLDLSDDNIDDEGVEVLVDALTNVNTLKELTLKNSMSITSRGWKAVSTLLEMPDSTLKKLDVSNNNIGDKGIEVFVTALANNNTLETLNLQHCGITREGWAPFSKLLCDTSSVNKTYLSNHTIDHIGTMNAVPGEVLQYLILNGNDDKQQVAMSKILLFHSHFDMQAFFEWEFKVLPLMVSWFTKATRYLTTYDQKIGRLRLSATFDFIKEFPMLYIEPVTRQEIAKYTALEEQLQGKPAVEEQLLQGDQVGVKHEVRLEEIRRHKARAMRRL